VLATNSPLHTAVEAGAPLGSQIDGQTADVSAAVRGEAIVTTS
jgi:hypothetical protein